MVIIESNTWVLQKMDLKVGFQLQLKNLYSLNPYIISNEIKLKTLYKNARTFLSLHKTLLTKRIIWLAKKGYTHLVPIVIEFVETNKSDDLLKKVGVLEQANTI